PVPPLDTLPSPRKSPQAVASRRAECDSTGGEVDVTCGEVGIQGSDDGIERQVQSLTEVPECPLKIFGRRESHPETMDDGLVETSAAVVGAGAIEDHLFGKGLLGLTSLFGLTLRLAAIGSDSSLGLVASSTHD